MQYWCILAAALAGSAAASLSALDVMEVLDSLTHMSRHYRSEVQALGNDDALETVTGGGSAYEDVKLDLVELALGINSVAATLQLGHPGKYTYDESESIFDAAVDFVEASEAYTDALGEKIGVLKYWLFTPGIPNRSLDSWRSFLWLLQEYDEASEALLDTIAHYLKQNGPVSDDVVGLWNGLHRKIEKAIGGGHQA